MPGGNTGVEGKGIWKAGRIVVPDIEIGIIGARSEQVATRRPTARVSSLSIRTQEEPTSEH